MTALRALQSLNWLGWRRHPCSLRAIGIYGAFPTIHLERLEYRWFLAVGPSRLWQTRFPALRKFNPRIVVGGLFLGANCKVQAHRLAGQFLTYQIGASTAAIEELGNFPFSGDGMAHLEPPGTHGLPVQGAVRLEPGEAFRQLVHDPQLAVVIDLLPFPLAIPSVYEKPHSIEPGLTYSNPITYGNGEAVVLRRRLILGLEALRQLTARYQPRAVRLGDVIMGLGLKVEIGRQFALEGETLGEEGTQGSATA